jgi:hypothetical protein
VRPFPTSRVQPLSPRYGGPALHSYARPYMRARSSPLRAGCRLRALTSTTSARRVPRASVTRPEDGTTSSTSTTYGRSPRAGCTMRWALICEGGADAAMGLRACECVSDGCGMRCALVRRLVGERVFDRACRCGSGAKERPRRRRGCVVKLRGGTEGEKAAGLGKGRGVPSPRQGRVCFAYLQRLWLLIWRRRTWVRFLGEGVAAGREGCVAMSAAARGDQLCGQEYGRWLKLGVVRPNTKPGDERRRLALPRRLRCGPTRSGIGRSRTRRPASCRCRQTSRRETRTWDMDRWASEGCGVGAGMGGVGEEGRVRPYSCCSRAALARNHTTATPRSLGYRFFADPLTLSPYVLPCTLPSFLPCPLPRRPRPVFFWGVCEFRPPNCSSCWCAAAPLSVCYLLSRPRLFARTLCQLRTLVLVIFHILLCAPRANPTPGTLFCPLLRRRRGSPRCTATSSPPPRPASVTS